MFATEAWEKFGDGAKVQLATKGVVAGAISCDAAAVDVTICERDCVFLSVTGEYADATVRYTASLSAAEARSVAELIDQQATSPTDENFATVPVEDLHADASTKLGDLGFIGTDGLVGGLWLQESDGVGLKLFTGETDIDFETGAAPYIHADDVDDLTAALRDGARVIDA